MGKEQQWSNKRHFSNFDNRPKTCLDLDTTSCRGRGRGRERVPPSLNFRNPSRVIQAKWCLSGDTAAQRKRGSSAHIKGAYGMYSAAWLLGSLPKWTSKMPCPAQLGWGFIDPKSFEGQGKPILLKLPRPLLDCSWEGLPRKQCPGLLRRTLVNQRTPTQCLPGERPGESSKHRGSQAFQRAKVSDRHRNAY